MINNKKQHHFIYVILAMIVTVLGSYFIRDALISDSHQLAQKNQKQQNDIDILPTTVKNPDVQDVPDFSSIIDVATKKRTFFGYLKPMVVAQNNLIEKERIFLQHYQKQVINNATLSPAQLEKFEALKIKYKVNATNNDQALTDLFKKVNVLPVNLVLIQAANETGWGSSRFAKLGLNFFGQWCFKKGCGLVPLSRNNGMGHEVAVFPSVEASVASYMKNLNSNHAYHELREIRYNLMEQGKPVTAEALIYGLINYSERKDAYIKELENMLRHNERFL